MSKELRALRAELERLRKLLGEASVYVQDAVVPGWEAGIPKAVVLRDRIDAALCPSASGGEGGT